MRKLWGALKRIWNSLRSISSSMVRRLTGGASSTVRAVGAGIGALAAFVVMLCILVLIAVVAVPYGIFGKDTKTDRSCDSVVDTEFETDFCELCGVADIELLDIGGKHVCIACRDDLNAGTVDKGDADVEKVQGAADETLPKT